jgi:microcompartment protein CcmL/EutN
MRSNIRNLIIVVVCIAVLGGALLTLKLTGNDQAVSSAVSSAASIELVSKKSEDVVSMTVENEKGSYTIVPIQKSAVSSSSQTSSESVSSSASSNTEDEITYTIKELSGCPINTSAAESVVRNGFSLVASKNLGTVSNLADYGLDNPQATVKVRFKDGSSYDYKIGNSSPTNSSAYYMCGLNSDNVYIVSVDKGLLEGPEYFVSREILSLSESGDENNFTKITLSGANYPETVTLTADEKSMKISSPANYEVDPDKLSAMKSALTSLTASDVVAVNPNETALEQYGFKNPTAVAAFSVNGKDYTLTAGAQDGDNYYVMLDGVNVVYKASSSSIEAWALQNLFALRSKIILMPNIETVKSLTIVADETENVLNIERTKNEEKSTEDKTYYDYTLTGNGGKSLDYETNYKKFYQKLIGTSILEDAKEKPAGEPVLTVKYQYFDDSKTDIIEFYQSGDRRYTAVLNGQVFGIVTQEDIDTLVQGITALENGQDVS